MVVVDQMGYEVVLNNPVKRIVSLVPSQTELLYELGLTNEVVGITRFCIHPTGWAKTHTLVGGTKNPDIRKIIELRPDVILANKEENDKKSILKLKNFFPVWLSDIKNIDDAISMIQSFGEFTGKAKQANKIASKIRTEFKTIVPCKSRVKVLYLIWNKPYMAVGKSTFIDHMLSCIGTQNVVLKKRYIILSNKDFRLLNPDIIMLSSEPFPFTEFHKDEIKKILPKANIIFVDGTFFSWYGSWLQYTPEYFTNFVIPQLN